MKKTVIVIFSLLILLFSGFASSCNNTDPADRVPVEGLSWGMSVSEITERLGDADEDLGTEGVDAILHYTKGVDTVFGKSSDLYLYVLLDQESEKSFGLYEIDGSIADKDTTILDKETEKLYGAWDSIEHDENKEKRGRITDGKLTPVEGLQVYRYVYEKWKVSNLEPHKRESLEKWVRAFNDRYSEGENRPETELGSSDLVSVSAEGIQGEKGAIFRVNAFYNMALKLANP